MEAKKVMSPDNRKKVLELISNRIFADALRSNLAPIARIRMIQTLMDVYADEVLKDYIKQLVTKFPAIEKKLDG